MKIRIGDKIIDPEDQPVIIMFQDDNERLLTAGQLTNMEPKAGPRVYAQFPAAHPVDNDYLLQSLKLAGYVG